jgi:hypothetical protein
MARRRESTAKTSPPGFSAATAVATSLLDKARVSRINVLKYQLAAYRLIHKCIRTFFESQVVQAQHDALLRIENRRS